MYLFICIHLKNGLYSFVFIVIYLFYFIQFYLNNYFDLATFYYFNIL